jgi:hypothetical protein
MIYVASPYSHPDKKIQEERYVLVSKACAELVSKGYIAFSPITYGHTLIGFKDMPGDWKFWNNFCISFLEKCETMIVLTIPGWEESVGIKEEIEFAKKNNIKVFYWDGNTLSIPERLTTAF